MRAFAHLHADLDRIHSDNDTDTDTEQLNALLGYLAEAPPADAAWAVYLLAGGKLPSTVPKAVLRQAALQAAGLDDWLFDACLQAVGDLAETISLVLPHALPPASTGAATQTSAAEAGLAGWIEQRLLGLRDLPAPEQASRLQSGWQALDASERWVLVKLVGGGWRPAVSLLLIQRALALHAGLDAHLIAQRMQGYTQARRRPRAACFLALIAPADEQPQADGQPHPFSTAAPIEWPHDKLADTLGPVGQWLIEWQLGGVPMQIVRRAGQVWLWRSDGELLNERFPEVALRALGLPDGVVLEGELLAWHGDAPAAHSQEALQRRLNRKTVSRAVLAQWPIGWVARDLLEADGIDRRAGPLHQRRARLEALMAGVRGHDWQLPALLCAGDWHALAQQRSHGLELGAEGLLLRHRDSTHGSAWSWKSERRSLHAVLLYAQADPGPRSGAGIELTWAIWNRKPRDADEAQAMLDAMRRREVPRPGGLHLVGVTKTRLGLDDADRARIEPLIRATTLEKFGPVRSLLPTLVAELAFEGVTRSARHKSGLALRGAHKVRLRDDRPLHEIDHLGMLGALLPAPPD